MYMWWTTGWMKYLSLLSCIILLNFFNNIYNSYWRKCNCISHFWIFFAFAKRLFECFSCRRRRYYLGMRSVIISIIITFQVACYFRAFVRLDLWGFLHFPRPDLVWWWPSATISVLFLVFVSRYGWGLYVDMLPSGHRERTSQNSNSASIFHQVLLLAFPHISF